MRMKFLWHMMMKVSHFVSMLKVSGEYFGRRHPDFVVDSDQVEIIRSVFIKPQHANIMGKVFANDTHPQAS